MPKSSKIGASGASKLALEAPKSKSGTSPRAKMHARGAQDQPKGAQERPKGTQEAFKNARDTPKRRPRGAGRLAPTSKIESGEVQNASPDAFGSVWGACGGPILAKSILRSLCERISIDFFDDRAKREP